METEEGSRLQLGNYMTSLAARAVIVTSVSGVLQKKGKITVIINVNQDYHSCFKVNFKHEINVSRVKNFVSKVDGILPS